MSQRNLNGLLTRCKTSGQKKAKTEKTGWMVKLAKYRKGSRSSGQARSRIEGRKRRQDWAQAKRKTGGIDEEAEESEAIKGWGVNAERDRKNNNGHRTRRSL